MADQLTLHLQGGTNGNGRRGIKLKRATPEQLAALVEEKRQVSTPLPGNTFSISYTAGCTSSTTIVGLLEFNSELDILALE